MSNPLIFLVRSSIGKKILMALTGLFLISFLLVHCGVNACIFFNDNGAIFTIAAEFMGTNWIIRTVEILLFVLLLVHIVDGLALYFFNRKKRLKSYEKFEGKSNSSWYSRSMTLLGTLLLIFLIIHLKHFWVGSRFTDEITSGKTTLFAEMKSTFTSGWVVLLYVISQVSLAYHLLHGFQSAFQTIGINHPRYTPFIKQVGIWFSILIPMIFAAMPVALYFEWIA